jgi:lactate dehydrogenase-like 2-hydroxyacid dehydrogenase
VERQTSARYVGLEELLSTSDVVSLHCPLNEDSRHLIDADALAQMKDTAILVNTARGAVVDEAALVEALDDGTIAAAGLDVFEKEPDVHPGLVEQERAVLAPHLGSATTEARTKMAQMCVASITAVLAGHEDVPHRAV